jgi:predicted N-formylglutamate amidohydrolase
MKKRVLVISCEHAGNTVPSMFSYLFKSADDVLKSHRGWDIGALIVAEQIAREFDVLCTSYGFTRLLIEANRSLHHHQLFSEYTQVLKNSEKKYLIETYYDPYRRKVENQIGEELSKGATVVHLSVHTFTPIWDGLERPTDIGLLFDESLPSERDFCYEWKRELEKLKPNYTIGLNEPYNGADDGFTTYLRTIFGQTDYLGIEIEVNQKFYPKSLPIVTNHLVNGLRACL